jgi:hypothetical protein
MILRRMNGSVSEDGCSFRCCTVGELLQDCDSVSVIAVQEKCDEKGQGAASGHRNVRCRQFGRGPFGCPPRLRSGLRQNRAGFLEKREKGAHPQLFRVNTQRHPRYSSSLKWPTRLWLRHWEFRNLMPPTSARADAARIRGIGRHWQCWWALLPIRFN